LQGSAGVQGAAAGVGMRKPLSGDSGFFIKDIFYKFYMI
jgi:hypothetical protein